MPSSAPKAKETSPNPIDDAELARLIEMDRQARIWLAKKAAKRKDVLAWGKALFPDKFHLPFCLDLHEYLISIRGFERTSTEAPRNHAKTVVTCFLVEIYQALEEPDTFKHYLNVQATEDKALLINRAIKHELENNLEVREIYGDQIGEKWTDSQFVMKNGVIFTAISSGQSIRGINYNNIRPDFIVGDDLYNDEHINNPEKTAKVNAWFWGTLYPARAKSRRWAIHLQGTAINDQDLLEELKKKPRWKCRTFDAILDEDKHTVLWPELNSWDDLMQDQYDMGSLIFNRELRNQRRDETTAIVKRSWLYPEDGKPNWEYDPAELRRELAKGHLRVFIGHIMGNDPSIGKDKESDDTGTALVLKTGWVDGRDGSDYWIERVAGEKLSLLARIEQLERWAKDLAPNEPLVNVRIEAIAAFDDYASEVIRKTNLPVERVSFVRDKISTLESKSHFFENGKVHLNKNIDPKVKDKLVHQLTTNHPKHDDLRDGVLLTLDDTSGLWRFV